MSQVFRVERTKNFTVMSNHHFKNKKLSLKAKGLLSLMLSLPDDWNYNMKGLASLSRDGIDSVRSAIKELEHHGYVERHRIRYCDGCYGDTEYIVREDDWNYNMKGLASLSRDGIDSVRSAIKELEHHGYVERHRIRYCDGCYGDTEYIVREVPSGKENE